MNKMLIGTITGYDGAYLTIRVPYGDRDYILDHRVTSCGVVLDDGLHISSAQNRALHATFRDIAEDTGNPEELTKETLKIMYAKEKGIAYFSLAEIGMDEAGEFLDWVLGWCVENDIPLSDKLSARCADYGRMMYACVMAKRCAVCGGASDLHHVDAIGMGGNRVTADHAGRRVMALCREHHTELHAIGDAAFCEKYMLTPVEVDRRIARKYRLAVK